VRILVAEDNLTNQKVALGLLRKLGYRAADVVANGAEALQALERTRYDIVLMDCQMPEIDGYEATTELRRREANGRHTIVIAMTAHALAGEREKCLAAGMDDYLTKPVKVQELAAIIKRWSEVAAAAEPEHSDAAAQSGPLDRTVLEALRACSGEGEEDLVSEVIDSYLADLERMIPELQAAAKKPDSAQLRQIAHALKGCSGNVGAVTMVQLCREIETRAPTADGAAVQSLSAAVAQESRRIRAALAAEKKHQAD
jgi:CheY-like chemotaxis protein